MRVSRRAFLRAGGLTLAGLAVPVRGSGGGVVEIAMMSDADGADVWFDPIGVRVEPGQTIRWVVKANVHTTTAYHPKNDEHSLRIPEGATPWDSRYLATPGQHFDVTLTKEGVYDYFCTPHEAAGMVGRIVVGKPGGPGTRPFDYFKGRPGTASWKAVPPAARKMFPAVATIMRQKVVRRA